MTVARINRIAEFEGQIVQLNGWVYNSRRSGKIGFLMFRDGFGIIQCIVAKNDVGEDQFEVFKSLTQESSLSVIGEVVKNDRAPGGFEMVVSELTVHQLSSEYPITPKEHGTDFLMNHRHLWLRSKRQYSILKVGMKLLRQCGISLTPMISPYAIRPYLLRTQPKDHPPSLVLIILAIRPIWLKQVNYTEMQQLWRLVGITILALPFERKRVKPGAISPSFGW